MVPMMVGVEAHSRAVMCLAFLETNAEPSKSKLVTLIRKEEKHRD